MHGFLALIGISVGLAWVIAAVVSCAYVADYPDRIAQMGLTLPAPPEGDEQ